MGDLFFNGIFPFVDVEHGGRVNGMIDNITKVLAEIDDDTIVIPGHGSLGTKQDLMDFHSMLAGTYKEINAMLKQGLTLEQMQAQGLSSKWQSFTQGFIDENAWIGLVYESIKAES